MIASRIHSAHSRLVKTANPSKGGDAKPPVVRMMSDDSGVATVDLDSLSPLWRTLSRSRTQALSRTALRAADRQPPDDRTVSVIGSPGGLAHGKTPWFVGGTSTAGS
jgi:hypothetical protein